MLYYYRIAELTLKSHSKLHSFGTFACEPARADVILEEAEETPLPGKEQVSGSIVHCRQPDGWFFHPIGTEETGLFVNDDYSHLRYLDKEQRVIAGIGEWFVRIALECWLAQHGYVSLHAAAIQIDEHAIAFTGPSGIGKSTRADMMIRNLGAKLINGDRPLIHVKDQMLYGVPWDGKEQCFQNVHYPLKAICEVRRSSSVFIQDMSITERRNLLVQQCFIPMWDTETALAQITNISRMSIQLPIFRAYSGPNAEDIQALYKALKYHE